MNLRRILLFGLAGSLALCALFAIFVVVTGAYNQLSLRIIITTLAVGFYSLTGLCCTPHLEGHIFKRRLAYVGIGVSVVGLLFACVTNWIDVQGFFYLLRYRFLFIVLSITVAHVSLLLMITPRNSMVRFAQYATVLCVTTVGALLLVIIVTPGFAIILGSISTALTVLAILDALGSIVTPLLHIASRT